jgi:hypothetical protein
VVAELEGGFTEGVTSARKATGHQMSLRKSTNDRRTEHEDEVEDPLSDVVLPGDPTPILFGLHELDFFETVCKYNGQLGRPWDGDKLAVLLDGLTEARELAKVIREASEHSQMAVLKESVRALIRKGYSITNIPLELDETLHDVAVALCNGRTSGAMTKWSESDWLAFESDIQSDMGATEVSETYDLSRTLVYRLRNLYDGKPGWKG